MGNDNEANRDVILSPLPNRSAAKKQLRVQLARNLFPVSCRASGASCGKIEIINDRQQGWTAARVLATPGSDRRMGEGVGAHTQNKAWKRSQSLWEVELGKAKQKPQTIHYPTATFSPANNCLWKSEEHYRKAVKVYCSDVPKSQQDTSQYITKSLAEKWKRHNHN